MPYPSEYYLEQIDRRVDARHLLLHPFYQAWSHGTLSRECLCQYAVEYYRHVRAFPTYLSALHAHVADESTRKHLLRNLIDEEMGEPNHLQLWRTFGLALGASEEALDTRVPMPAIDQLIATFRKVCFRGDVAEGIAALYAYESQIPAVSHSKISGLRAHYGLERASAWEYFTVHIHADEEHAAVERQLLGTYLTCENAKEVLYAVDQVLDALWSFLSSLCERYKIAA